MLAVENECVGCPPGIGCIGDSCPYRNAAYNYCDECGDIALYRIEGQDMCEDCAERFLQECFDDLSMFEKAQAMDIQFDEL